MSMYVRENVICHSSLLFKLKTADPCQARDHLQAPSFTYVPIWVSYFTCLASFSSYVRGIALSLPGLTVKPTEFSYLHQVLSSPVLFFMNVLIFSKPYMLVIINNAILHSLIHLFKNNLLDSNYMLESLLDTVDLKMTKTQYKPTKNLI